MSGLRERDAHAGGHQQLVAVDQERQPEGFGHGGRDLLGLLERRDALEQHRELIAAEPGDRVGRPRALDEPLRSGLQQPVADVVPERVVHVLEVVEVDHQDRQSVLGAPRERDSVLDAIAEQAPVRKQRQRVVEGELAKLVLECLALGHVAQVEGESLYRRVVEQVAADAFCDEALVLGADVQIDRADRAALGCLDLGKERGDALAVRLAPDLAQPAADEVLVPQAERALHGGRRVLDAAVGTHDHYRVRRIADQRREAGLDEVHGLALALLGVVTQDHALPGHDQHGEHEDHHGHDRQRVLPVAAREVHEHEEGQAKASVGDALVQGTSGRGALALRSRLVADLHLRRAGKARVAGEI